MKQALKVLLTGASFHFAIVPLLFTIYIVPSELFWGRIFNFYLAWHVMNLLLYIRNLVDAMKTDSLKERLE